MAIRFLTLAEAVEIHQDQIVRYGGDPGTRDRQLLESSLAMPAATFRRHFLHSDIFEMAAAYLYHLVQNHPFVDGNKRVGAVAAIVFLALNGYEFNAPQGALYGFVMKLVQGDKRKSDAAQFMRKYTVEL